MYKFLDFGNTKKVIDIIKNEKFLKYDPIKDGGLESVSFYSIFEDNQEVGFFGLESRDYSLCFCYFYIFKPFRRKGYGRKILEEIIRDFKDKYGYIYGLVEEENKRALKLYLNYHFLGKSRTDLFKLDDFEKRKDVLLKNEDGLYEVCFYFNQEKFDERTLIKEYHS